MKWHERVNKDPKVYLAGPINGRTNSECTSWRDRAQELLSISSVDPMQRDYRGIEDANAQELVADDKHKIISCRWLLAFCWSISVGTSMEILFAHERGLRVVVVSIEPVSPWLMVHSELVVETLDEACAYINTH